MQMRSYCFAAALAVALAPAAMAAQDRPAEQSKETQITLRGCVVPGENNTYVLANADASSANGTTMPEMAHGRRIVFWLKNDNDVKGHANKMVEVAGRFTDLKESEIELKAGAHKDGGLVVEFEGPGRDVRASNATVGTAVGTAGRQTPEANDIKTYLAEVTVTGVKVVAEKCE